MPALVSCTIPAAWGWLNRELELSTVPHGREPRLQMWLKTASRAFYLVLSSHFTAFRCGAVLIGFQMV